MDTYFQPPVCGPQGQEGPSSATSSLCVMDKPLPSLGLGFPVCPGGMTVSPGPALEGGLGVFT